MIESLRARWAIIIAVFILAVIWTVPNFMDTDKHWWPTKNKMVLGLDIQGGSHLVLGIDVNSAVRQDAKRLAISLPTEIKNDSQVDTKEVVMVDALTGSMKIPLNSAADRAKVEGSLKKLYEYTLRDTGFDAAKNEISVEYAELYLRDFKTKLLDQAIATIRNRIDEFGVAEPSITAQGTDRILVQLPGIKDASAAKDLINRTARLDFMIVSKKMAPAEVQNLVADAEKTQNIKLGELKYSAYVDKINAALKDKLPANTVIYFEKPDAAANMEVAHMPYLLSTDESVTGDRLVNAQVSTGEFGKPVVAFSFDPVGARQFAALTTKHTGEPMAIVLDKVIKSAPNIQTPITGGHGQITLGGSRNPNDAFSEAKLIATALRAGALPAALEQLEERTVGPSLGADAIRQGQIGTVIAALAVFTFMIIFYRSYGFIADLSLAFNVLITVAILSSLGATLTLPGVAGLALTLGISVDASVIIFERIKEEMRKGRTATSALHEGYDRAFSSILDANLTSIAVCVVLMYFGTGPVRGFAVTLLTGLVITTFTAVFFTRTIFNQFVTKWGWNLSIGSTKSVADTTAPAHAAKA